jgi:tetraacyldisaccharide 4'-kinase
LDSAYKHRLATWFNTHWYSNSPVGAVLAPLSWLFCLATALRRGLYRAGLLPTHRLGVPVIVVGNITVGGTGKTPLVIALARLLRDAGFHPCIVGRGYGGSAGYWPQQVRPDSDPTAVGDEPVLIAARTRCPVAVAPDRAAAAASLVKHARCDIIISDDGLQHYRLGRDIEIAVIDGVRRFGNGRCLPAGPLREPRRRLAQVDFVVTTGLAAPGETAMTLNAAPIRNVHDDDLIAGRHQFNARVVHAVAGIGNPDRFFAQLRSHGLTIVEHPFPDHHHFQPTDLDFGDAAPVIMTEKDAVKCRRFAGADHWYLPVEARLEERFTAALTARVADLTARSTPPAPR